VNALDDASALLARLHIKAKQASHARDATELRDWLDALGLAAT
jgi:hypothetical protein